ncbi:MAG: hypothetical protein ACI9HK_004492 [Pirellulaceae bacterium]|jgi:hypothetical protein
MPDTITAWFCEIAWFCEMFLAEVEVLMILDKS